MRSIYLYSLILLLSANNILAQMNTFSYSRKLNKVEKEGFYSVPLLPGITSHCKSNLNDIRLYKINDTDTAEVPYLLEWLGDKTEESPINFELINDVTNLKCCSYITLKMSKKSVINKITLDVLENNFDKIIVIEGSNDNKEWFTIKKHLRITGFVNNENNFQSASISFPSSEFIYFRLKFDDDASGKINITGAHAFENKTTKGNYDELAIKTKKQTENKTEKTSELIVDLADNYFINRVRLKSNLKTDFYRNINIYRSIGIYHTPKGDEDSWQLISSGIIASNEENIFSLDNSQSKRLKVEVINYDNEPVSLDEIQLFSEKIALITKLSPDFFNYLAYGKENTTAPVYDLVHFKDKIPSSLIFLSYGNEEVQNKAIIKAEGEPMLKNKMWLWIIMGVIILLIGYFALNMLRKE
jgi:hypothetical protein